jgi:hypothetical protein
MLDQGFSGNLIKAHAFYAGYCASKAFVNHLLVEANDFKYLGSLIGLECGNTHLGEDFQ